MADPRQPQRQVDPSEGPLAVDPSEGPQNLVDPSEGTTAEASEKDEQEASE